MSASSEEKRFIKNLGLKLRELREAKGWTLEYTEERGYPSWRHLQEIESGKRNLSIISIRRIAKVYQIPISKIFSGLE